MKYRVFAVLLALSLLCAVTYAGAQTYEGVAVPLGSDFTLTVPSQWNKSALTNDDLNAGVMYLATSQDGGITLICTQYAAESYTLDDMMFQMQNNDLIASVQFVDHGGLNVLEYQIPPEEGVYTNGIVLSCSDGYFYEITIRYVGEANAALSLEVMGTITPNAPVQ